MGKKEWEEGHDGMDTRKVNRQPVTPVKPVDGPDSV